MRYVFWLLLVICLFIPLSALGNPIYLELKTKDPVISLSRKKITALYIVRNDFTVTRTFETKIDLPEGWKIITNIFPFMLEPRESDIRILNFFIPQGTMEGNYKVGFTVYDQENPVVRNSYALTVTILPEVILDTKLVSAPSTPWPVTNTWPDFSFSTTEIHPSISISASEAVKATRFR